MVKGIYINNELLKKKKKKKNKQTNKQTREGLNSQFRDYFIPFNQIFLKNKSFSSLCNFLEHIYF